MCIYVILVRNVLTINKILNIGMYIVTIPLIILSLISVLLADFSVALLLGLPFIILGLILLLIKNKLLKKEEIILSEKAN